MYRLHSAPKKRALALLLCLAALFGMAAFPAEASAEGWTHVVDVIAGNGYTVGLRSDGTALFAGDDVDMARALANWNGVVRMEKKGWAYLVGYRADGSLCLAGYDPWGYESLWTQAELSGWKGITDLHPEYNFCAGLRSDGTVVLVSRDPEINRYMNSRVASWQNVTQICTGYFGILGLRRDGTVEYAGTSREDEEESWGMEQFPGLRNVRELAAGEYGPYAILNDGSVVPSSRGFTNIEKLYFASDSMFGLRRDGTVAAFHYYAEDPRIDEVESWHNVAELGFTVDGWARYVPTALLADGTVRAVTRGYEGEPYGEWDVSGWRDVVRLFSGSYYTVGLRSDGSLLVTGGEFGSFGFLSQLGSWRNITRIAVSPCDNIEEGHIVGLHADGTVTAAGNNSHGQCNIG